jgi:predicted dithiol-disulfide oxidoreductase (DUF899 family)
MGKEFNSYRYIYPPRPETVIPVSGLEGIEKRGFIAQPKLNGSCCIVFTDGKSLHVMNRDSQAISVVKLPREEFLSLHRGKGWMVLVGEYMNKSKKDSQGKLFNHKFVIFDILVFQGEYLTGKTFSERQSILDVIYEWKKSPEIWLSQFSENVFRADNITEDFEIEYGLMTKFDMYEGLVMKKPSAKLEVAAKKANNTGWQLKCRKETKNYSR